MGAFEIDANRALWDEWAAEHETSRQYDIPGFLAGGCALRPLELEEVGSVDGKRLAHLMCHIGTDTLSWARMGAEVTGLDFSEKAIEIARGLADKAGLQARFVAADVYDAVAELGGGYDIVFTSWGVLNWLRDLPEWALVVVGLLKPGGVFYLAEIHPFSQTLELDEGGTLTVTEGYFGSGEAERWDCDSSYVVDAAAGETRPTYQWTFTLGDVVSALIAAGLRIELLHEWPFSVYRQRPEMEQAEDGWFYYPARRDVPLSFSLRAVRD